MGVSCLYVSAIADHAEVSMGFQKRLRDLAANPFEYMPRGILAEWDGDSTFFLRTHHTVFMVAVLLWTPLAGTRVPNSEAPLIFSFLVGH